MDNILDKIYQFEEDHPVCVGILVRLVVGVLFTLLIVLSLIAIALLAIFAGSLAGRFPFAWCIVLEPFAITAVISIVDAINFVWNEFL